MTKSESPVVESTEKSKDLFLKKLVTREKVRYERKGYGLIFAILIAGAFVVGVPVMA